MAQEAQNIERVIAYLENLKCSEVAMIYNEGNKATQIMQHELLLGDAMAEEVRQPPALGRAPLGIVHLICPHSAARRRLRTSRPSAW